MVDNLPKAQLVSFFSGFLAGKLTARISKRMGLAALEKVGIKFVGVLRCNHWPDLGDRYRYPGGQFRGQTARWTVGLQLSWIPVIFFSGSPLKHKRNKRIINMKSLFFLCSNTFTMNTMDFMTENFVSIWCCFFLHAFFWMWFGHPKLVPNNVQTMWMENSSPESVHELSDTVNGPTFKQIGIFRTFCVEENHNIWKVQHCSTLLLLSLKLTYSSPLKIDACTTTCFYFLLGSWPIFFRGDVMLVSGSVFHSPLLQGVKSFFHELLPLMEEILHWLH